MDKRGVPGGRVASSRRVRAVVAVGWFLLTLFVLRVALLGDIAADVRTFQVAYLLGFCGYLALLWAVARARVASTLGRWRWWLTGAVALRVLLLTTQPSDDTYRYVWEGRIQRAGHNPFLLAPDAPELVDLRDDKYGGSLTHPTWSRINHPDHPAIYPPLAQMEFAVVATFSSSVYSIKLVHVLWDALVVVVLGACLRRRRRRQHWAIAYALCPLVLTAIGVEGHLDSLMLLLLALMVWAVSSGRIHVAGAMLGLAISAKIVAVVLLPWFLIRHRRAALIAIACLAVTYVPYRSGGIAGLSNLVHFAGMGECFSLAGAFFVTSFDSDFPRAAAAVLLGVILLGLAWKRDDLTHYAAAATGALLMLLPVVHFWYLSWVLLLLPFRLSARWIVGAAAWVVYFEAEAARTLTGEWSMPAWAPLAAWTAVLLTWIVEAIVAARGASHEDPPCQVTPGSR